MNRTVLITGGSRGLGRYTALAFGEAGFNVAICGRTKDDLDEVVQDIRDVDGTAMCSVVDVSRFSQVQAFVTEVELAMGPVDVLINNAGFSHYKPFVDWSVDELDEAIDVNLKGTMYTCRAVLPGMLARHKGYILNISSDVGRRPVPNMAAYVAAKHAIVGFSGSLLREVRQAGVKVSVVMPGIIDTHFGGTKPGTRDHHWAMKPEDVAAVLLGMVTQPGNLVLDEVTLHPLGQEF